MAAVSVCIPKDPDVKPSLIWAVYIALTRRKRSEFSSPARENRTWISFGRPWVDGLDTSKLFPTAWKKKGSAVSRVSSVMKRKQEKEKNVILFICVWCVFFFPLFLLRINGWTESPVWILTADWKSHTLATHKKSWSLETRRPQCLNFFEFFFLFLFGRERERGGLFGWVICVMCFRRLSSRLGGVSLFLDCQNLSFFFFFFLRFYYYSGCFTVEESCECRPNLFSPWFDCPVSSFFSTLSLVRARSCNSSGTPFTAKSLAGISVFLSFLSLFISYRVLFICVCNHDRYQRTNGVPSPPGHSCGSAGFLFYCLF